MLATCNDSSPSHRRAGGRSLKGEWRKIHLFHWVSFRWEDVVSAFVGFASCSSKHSFLWKIYASRLNEDQCRSPQSCVQYCDKLLDQTVPCLFQQVLCLPLLCWLLVWSPSIEAMPSCLKILCGCVLWHKAAQYWHCAAGCMWALGPTISMQYDLI